MQHQQKQRDKYYLFQIHIWQINEKYQLSCPPKLKLTNADSCNPLINSTLLKEKSNPAKKLPTFNSGNILHFLLVNLQFQMVFHFKDTLISKMCLSISLKNLTIKSCIKISSDSTATGSVLIVNGFKCCRFFFLLVTSFI